MSIKSIALFKWNLFIIPIWQTIVIKTAVFDLEILEMFTIY